MGVMQSRFKSDRLTVNEGTSQVMVADARQKIDPIMQGPEGGRRLEWVALNARREEGANRAAWNALAKRAVARIAGNLCTCTG